MASERVLSLCLCLICCLTMAYCKKIDFKFCVTKSDFKIMLDRECGVTVSNTNKDGKSQSYMFVKVHDVFTVIVDV